MTDEEAVAHLQDILSGKVLPTFKEFVFISVYFGYGEQINLKELYPGMYKKFQKRVKEMRQESWQRGKTKDGHVRSSDWLWQ